MQQGQHCVPQRDLLRARCQAVGIVGGGACIHTALYQQWLYVAETKQHGQLTPAVCGPPFMAVCTQDMLKFDGCGGPFESVKGMRDALNATGRPIVYSVHSSVMPGTMQPSLANQWRTGPDIGATYEQILDRAMIANNVSAYLPVGPGGWGDPDMLQVRFIAAAYYVTIRIY